ncbi:MAG: ArsA-related P-loop ATPase [Oligoflexia bacterium]|nr:ArsA-related P-loop ATPase [Oligoflexia bacterium]
MSPARTTPSGSSISAIIAKRRIIVTCGTGGVGKTTLSAAIAVKAALAGKRAVVITIDPAKRLATSLGVKHLGDEATDLTEQLRIVCKKVDPTLGKFTGALSAIIPDTRRTFESFVKSIASTPAGAERVMKNPIFQIFAKEFSGTNEYMALERLYALAMETENGRPRYDCIVLDTPPSRSSQGFLEAPGLLARFFEEKLIRWLAFPANALVAAGMKKALGILERLTGAGFMTSLVDFATGLLQVQSTFTANLKRVMELLESKEVGFILVTTPSPGTAPDLRHFVEKLSQHKMRLDGISINRTLSYLTQKPLPKNPSAGEKLVQELIERERQLIRELRASAADAPICSQLPEFARDVHTLEDLVHVSQALEP